MCSIMALKRDGLNFNPFFQHRLAEIRENLTAIADAADHVEPVRKVKGESNPADIATRSGTKPEDLQPQSTWQKGPEWLREPRNLWPIDNDEDETAIPDKEIKKIHAVSIRKDYFGPDNPKFTMWIQDICCLSLNLEQAKGVIARCLKGTGNKDYKSIHRVEPMCC